MSYDANKIHNFCPGSYCNISGFGEEILMLNLHALSNYFMQSTFFFFFTESWILHLLNEIIITMAASHAMAKNQYDNGYEDALKTAKLCMKYDIYCFFLT